ncbi:MULTISPECIES: RidA family protein [Enterobacteriaceae]|uniref:RidA family protein n=1 Tax=Raoultella lignicola TaxID=3040939 RepID=A0ABU9FA65_9ENTR|nr:MULTISPECIES: RidA family protein [Enterobacteriaceae]MRT48604.1 RidA family protein [Raoultella sp. RIT712]QNK09072.1 RidA family protein [Enterobacter sp. JUb54]ROS15686.1 enamine deaminase RidA (YjgF/YER057c/UK114 family) [Raoultella sp. BIGb0399]
MSDRSSIYSQGFVHSNPVPAACRIGNMVFSGVIYGRDPLSGVVPDDIDAQCALMFANLKTVIEDAGGSLDNIARLTLWMADKSERERVNPHWLRYFPDPASRPARYAIDAVLSGNIRVQCDFIAVL